MKAIWVYVCLIILLLIELQAALAWCADCRVEHCPRYQKIQCELDLKKLDTTWARVFFALLSNAFWASSRSIECLMLLLSYALLHSSCHKFSISFAASVLVPVIWPRLVLWEHVTWRWKWYSSHPLIHSLLRGGPIQKDEYLVSFEYRLLIHTSDTSF